MAVGFISRFAFCVIKAKDGAFDQSHDIVSLSILPPRPRLDGRRLFPEPVAPWNRPGLGREIRRAPRPRRWQGYYTDNLSVIHPPMTVDLDFWGGRSDDDRVSFCGKGSDSAGAFSLFGEVSTRDGTVFGRKTYVDAHHWEWSGVWMEDGLGMVGTWYGLRRRGPDNVMPAHPDPDDVTDCAWWWIWPCYDDAPDDTNTRPA